MLREFQVRSYGCLQDVRLMLTPLHALIGPNDSGKSTMLGAIRAVCRAAGRQPFPDVRFSRSAPGLELRGWSAEGDEYTLSRAENGLLSRIT